MQFSVLILVLLRVKQGWANYSPLNIFAALVHTMHTFSLFCVNRLSLTYHKSLLLEKHAV